jgi:cation transport regulator
LSEIKRSPLIMRQERAMPYASNHALPPSVRHHLPPPAQDIYREAFNHAWQTYALDPQREEISYRTAWAAVKHRYAKGEDGEWHAHR